MTVIKVEKLCKKIKDKEILRNISFEINDGECVALIGPNGAGKTTLLDCLLGDKLVTSGQVSIQDLPVTSSKLDYTRSYLSIECNRSETKGKRVDCFLSKNLSKSLE